MKFFCEYCGNRIDAEKDAKCPNCGASYKKNQSFIKLESEKKKLMQTNQENAQKIFNHVFGVFKISRIIFFIPIVIFIIIFVTAVITINSDKNDLNPSDNNIDMPSHDNNMDEIFEDLMGGNKEEQQNVVVGLDEFAETKEYIMQDGDICYFRFNV